MNCFSKLFIFSSIFFFNISFSGEWGDILPSQLPKPPEIKVEIDFPAKQPVRPQCIYDPSIRKLISSSTSRHGHCFQVEVRLQPKPSWTSENFRDYFAQLFGNNQELVTIFRNNDGTLSCKFAPEVQQYIFNQSQLYVHPGFRDFVRTLDGFETFIVDFKNSLWHNPHHMNAINAKKYQLPEIRALCDKSERTFCSHMCEWFTDPCYKSKPDIVGEKTATQAPILKQEIENTLKDPLISTAHRDACEQRQHALNITIDNNGALSIINLEVTPAVIEQLKQYGFNPAEFTVSMGSAVMHAMKKELLDLERQLIWLPKEGVLLAPNIEKCVVVGLDYTKQGNIGNAMAFADICHVTIDHIKKFGMVLAECTQGVGLGVCDGIVNTAHMLRHPVKTAQGIITGMSTIASYVSQAMLRMGYIHELSAIDPEAGYQEQFKFTHEVNQITDAVTNALNEKYAAMSTRDIVRQGTSFLVEGYLTGKAITTLSSLSSKAVMLSRIAAGSIKNIARSSEALEPIAAGVGKIEKQAGMLLNEIEGQAKNIGTVEGQLGKAVEQEAKQLGSQIKSVRQTAEVATEWWETYQNKWSGNVIKEFDAQALDLEKIVEHTLSEQHCKAGILNIAPTEQEVFDVIIQKIRQADNMHLIKNDMNNQIRTVINGIQLEIRVYVENNEALMFNGFILKQVESARNFGNIVHL